MVAVVFAQAERQHLESMARRLRTASQLTRQVRIVRGCEGPRTTTRLPRGVGLSPAAGGKWRTRFARYRVDGLLGAWRRGTARTVTDAQVGQVVITRLKTRRGGATHWSASSLAPATGVSRMTVSGRLASVRVASAPGRDLEAVA